MDSLRKFFNERLSEVDAYFEFLKNMEEAAQRGLPRWEGSTEATTPQQQKILYSTVFLQLYNLVESTVSTCIETLVSKTLDQNRYRLNDLVQALQTEWIRSVARTHVNLTSDNRLICAVEMCNHILSSVPLAPYEIERGGGGNWDDDSIEDISGRLGFTLVVDRQVYSNVKRRVKDDMGALKLIRYLRNKLAHGSISFYQAAEDMTVRELIDLKNKTVEYMREVVRCFSEYIERYEFLRPNARPETQASA